MARLKLRNKVLKTNLKGCKQAYNKERNLGVAMVWKPNTNYFNLSERNISVNKQF